MHRFLGSRRVAARERDADLPLQTRSVRMLEPIRIDVVSDVVCP